MSELIPISGQVIDQQPDGSHSNPPQLETGGQDNEDALLEVTFSMVPPEGASLMIVIDRVAPEHIRPIIQLR